jgi:hypothetical protein
MTSKRSSPNPTQRPTSWNLFDAPLAKAVAHNAPSGSPAVAHTGLLNDFASSAAQYTGASHVEGEVVRMPDGALAMVLKISGKKAPVLLTSGGEDIAAFANKLGIVREHQRLLSAPWPSPSTADFHARLHAIFRGVGIEPSPTRSVDPKACYKASGPSDLSLKPYQRIAGLYLIYSPTRAVIVNHSMGSGKTCTAIHAMDQFVAFKKLEEEMNNSGDPVLRSPSSRRAPPGSARVFFVIPPRESLRQNMQAELERCPGKVRSMLEARGKGSSPEQYARIAARIVNQNVNIISYVSHRLQTWNADLGEQQLKCLPLLCMSLSLDPLASMARVVARLTAIWHKSGSFQHCFELARVQ